MEFVSLGNAGPIMQRRSSKSVSNRSAASGVIGQIFNGYFKSPVPEVSNSQSVNHRRSAGL